MVTTNINIGAKENNAKKAMDAALETQRSLNQPSTALAMIFIGRVMSAFKVPQCSFTSDRLASVRNYASCRRSALLVLYATAQTQFSRQPIFLLPSQKLKQQNEHIDGFNLPLSTRKYVQTYRLLAMGLMLFFIPEARARCGI